MNHAIEIGDGLAVMPVFFQEPGARSTPNGMEPVVVTTCVIYNARGLAPLGIGDAIKAADDEPNDTKATKLALARALKQTSFTTNQRNIIFKALLDEVFWQEHAPQDCPPDEALEGLEKFLDSVKAYREELVPTNAELQLPV